MKKTLLLGVASLGLLLGCAASANRDVIKEEKDATIIVKLKDDANQNSVLNQIRSNITSNFKVTNRYSAAFNGFAMDIPSKYVAHIRNLNRVDMVDYDHIIAETRSMQDGYTYKLSVSNKTASANTMEKPDGTNDGAKTFVAILDNGFYLGYDEDGNAFQHNVFKPLANAEDAVITRESLKAKIDAASNFHGKYDETHTTYFNNKVPFYYDYGGDSEGMATPDFDVYAEGQDHGTHVASIAGGNAGEEYEGIAPRAQLALMKVFYTYLSGQEYVSGAPEIAVLNALEDCLILQVDVINMSLGSNLDDFDDASILQSTIRQLEAAGTHLSIANGNEGKAYWSSSAYKYWTTDMVETNIISSYANNLASMSVASNQADSQFYGEAITVDGVNVPYEDEVIDYNTVDGPVKYDPNRHMADLIKDHGDKKEFDFVYIDGIGAAEDYEDLNVTGKIVVVNRGDTTFRNKVEIATSKGAIAIIIIDNTTATELKIRMSFGDDGFTPAIPVAFALNSTKDTFKNSKSNKIVFKINEELDNPTARTVSDYSSDGMRFDLSIKPEISTPGENIKGAVLGAVDKYESMSGTSMAAPNYAGAVALLMSEHIGDADYRDTIKARLMSTAHPMRDYTEAANFTSVRRQGAGLVNLDGALNSKVYLDGEANGKRIGKAKIELFNGEDIAKGELNLSFFGINESNAAVAYTATTYVLAPEVVEYDAESYPELAGSKMQSVYTQLVQTFTDNITIEPGEANIKINHTINASKLAELDNNFANGCVLDGYVILTPVDTTLAQLSIPFLGFYGDYSAISPSEDFDFEHKQGKVYDSDILNYLLRINIGNNGTVDFTKADYTSRMVSGYWKDYPSSTPIATNKQSILDYKDDNKNAVNHVGYNPFTGKFDANSLYIGNTSVSNTLFIQQYMMRSVNDNTITLQNKANPNIVATSSLSDDIFGGVYHEESQTYSYPLYKSHFDTSLYSKGGYAAHAALGYVKLVDEAGNALPEGEYTLKFSYDLAGGGTYVKTYTVTIINTMPSIQSMETVTVNDKDYYRIHYNDKLLSEVVIGGKSYTPVIAEDDVYVDVLVSDIKGAVRITSKDSILASDTYLAHLDDKNSLMVNSMMVLSDAAYDFSYSISKEASNNQIVKFEFTKGGKAVSISEDITYKMLVPAGLDIATISVYTINSAGKEREIEFRVEGDYIVFTTPLKTVRLISTGSTPDEPTGKKGCRGEIITTSCAISILALAGSALLLLRKKKED